MKVKKVKRYVRGKKEEVWVYDFRLGGRRYRTPRGVHFFKQSDAIAAVDAIRGDYQRRLYNLPRDSLLLLKDARDAWLGHLRLNKRSPHYLGMTERAWDLFGEVLPLDTPVTRLEKRHYSKYIQHLEAGTDKRKPISRQTAMLYLVMVRAGVKYFFEENYKELPGWLPPKAPVGLRKRLGRERIITREEEAAILAFLRAEPEPRYRRHAASRRQLADAFELAIYTGMRAGEILGLTVSSVSLRKSPGYPLGWVIAHATKTGERSTGRTDDRTIPLNKTSRAILERRVAAAGDSLYLFGDGFSRQVRAQEWTQVLKNTCKKLGIPYGRKQPGGLVFHDTRHTAATRMIENGYSVRTVMELLGHDQIETTKIYSHSTPASRSLAILSLDDEPAIPLLQKSRVRFASADSSNSVIQRPTESIVGDGEEEAETG